MQNLRFNLPRTASVAALHFERVRLCENSARWQLPLAPEYHAFRCRSDLHSGTVWKTDPPLRGCAIGPAGGVHLVRHHARRRLLLGGLLEKSHFAQPSRKGVFISSMRIFLQSPQTAAAMVQHHELAVLPDAKRSGHEGAPAEHPMLPNFTALGAQTPQSAHLPITVNVHVREFRQSFASVKFAARDAGRLLVGMSHQRLKDRRGALRTVRAYVLLASLGNAPAVIAALLNAHNALPQFPADFTHQKVSCFCVEGQTPRIPKPIRPDFAARLGQRDKRVVLWNGVQLPRFLAVHINSQNA